MKSVDPAVRADVPGFSQVGGQVQIWIEGNQSAVDEFVAGTVCGGRIVLPGIGALAAREDQGLLQWYLGWFAG